jgi:hypothetical protein
MKQIVFISLIFIILSFVSCTKFEEGPKYSLTSADKKIVRKWTVEYILDFSNNEKYTAGMDDWAFYIFNNSKFRKIYTHLGKTHAEYGSWELTDDILKLQYKEQDYNFEKQYKILRLTKTEMWLINDSEEIHYKSVVVK